MPDRAAFPTGSRLRVALAVLGLLAVLCSSLASGFLVDDWFHLERAARPLTGGALDFSFDTGDAGVRLWVHPEPVHIRFVRPGSSLSFWLDRRVWGLNAWGFHLTNILAHAIAALAIWALARAIGIASGLAVLVAAAWSVSAATVPAVQWISGRTEILCGAASFAAALAFLHWDRTRRTMWLVLATALAAVSVGAKETGVAVAPFAACLVWARRALHPGSHKGGLSLPLLVLATPALMMLGYRSAEPGSWLPEGAYTDRVHGAGDALWFALKPAWALIATLVSAPVSHLGPLDAMRSQPLLALAALAAGLAVVATVVRAAGARTAWPLLAAFIVTLAPSLPVYMTTLYFYQPAAALALLLGVAASRRPRQRAWLGYWIAAGVIAHLGIAYLTATASRLQDAQLAFIESELLAKPAERVIVIDAPFWMYGVPVAMRVRGEVGVPEMWFVNFAPGLRTDSPSALSWPDPLEMHVQLPRGGGLLSSSIERFLAFGGSASATASDGAITISAVEPVPNPRLLSVRYADRSALEQSLVLRVLHGRPEVIRASSRPGQGPQPSP